MREALIADLVAIPGSRIVTTVDPRFPLKAARGVDVVTVRSSAPRAYLRMLDPLIASADAVWVIAPETDRCLERLAGRVEASGTALLGPGARAIRVASDKGGLARLFGRHAIPYPKTRSVRLEQPINSLKTKLETIVRAIGYPMVVKPAQGAGSEGVWLVRDGRQLQRAVQARRTACWGRRVVIQQYIVGTPASVSLLADGRRAVALAVNGQSVRSGRPFSYQGGSTPLVHPLAREASELAARACEAVPGLRGYIGVDVVLAPAGAVVIEINPRLTTAYLGVRRVLGKNVAAMAIAACAGALPRRPPAIVHRPVSFSADGRILP
jgi:predicted ATP-grasp superfamily ATP-dependent carboligase